MPPAEMSGSGDWLHRALLGVAGGSLAVGLALRVAMLPDAANAVWGLGVLPVLAALLVDIVASLRRGEIGLDIVAALSMSAALIIGETLAAAVVALMYTGGSFLESYAQGRARRDIGALLARVPRVATRYEAGGLTDVPLDAVAPGDRLLVRQGDVVPVDGTLESEAGFLDTSALTGESLPVRLARGADVLSGVTNAGEAFDLIATRPAQDSAYAGIVRLVEAAQHSRAPMARLADRWSLGFLALTVVIAASAYGFTGDPVRAVAVLVVATPCPLILAVPVALVAGLSRAARFGVLVKGAGTLEALARVRTLVLDKTGTLTEGRPRIVAIEPAPGIEAQDLLRLAAGLEQASQHPMARALVAAARARGLSLALPAGVSETPGEGLSGTVEGRRVVVGGWGYVVARLSLSAPVTPPRAADIGEVVVAVALDGAVAGHIIMADPLRAGAAEVLDVLRARGIRRLLLATGDREAVARRVAGGLGLDAIHAGLTPDQKVRLVQAERAAGPVMMVGDGVNDAPSLAAADVGVAMGARGAAASAAAADVVLLVDRIDPLATGLAVAQGARRIALQSVVLGIGLSMIGMVAAALGWLTPVQGALIQEAIDVAAIMNALRALRVGQPPG